MPCSGHTETLSALLRRNPCPYTACQPRPAGSNKPVTDIEKTEQIISSECLGSGAVLIFTIPKDRPSARGKAAAKETR